MQNLVLVHGAWHGAWCFEPMLQYLSTSFNVINIELPGRIHEPKLYQKLNLTSHAKHIADYLTKISNKNDEQYIILGHSMAGLIITELLKYIPNKIKALIYLAAFVPNKNQSLFDITSSVQEPGLSSEFIVDVKRNFIELKKSATTKKLLFNTTANDTADQALQMLSKEPLRVFSQKVTADLNAFPEIQKTYIKCKQDKAISANFQTIQADKLGDYKYFEIDSDHSPFFSATLELAEIILKHSFDRISIKNDILL